jgi:Tol biopolymer transport system component
VSKFVLTDAAIERALAPGFDVAAPADFTKQIALKIAPQTRQSRWWLLNPAAWSRQSPLITQMLLLLLLLVLLVGAVAVASLTKRGLTNGHVIIATGAELVDIDPETGATSSLLTGDGRIFGVTRSDDGRLISFWTETRTGTTLEVVNAAGGDRRQLAENVIPSPISEGQIDVISPDRRSLAAGVKVGGEQRILLVDISSGIGKLIGPSGAANPLWAPDGQLLAFSYVPDGRSVVGVMRADGSGVRNVSGDLGVLNASGVNNWSPDGVWLYFGAEHDDFQESYIFRARVDAGYSEQLTFDLVSAAPALSPDGTEVAYSEWERGVGIQNLNVMDADGSNQRMLLASALNKGWSNDGQFLLAEWRPVDAPFELLVLRPDGTDRQTLMIFEAGCVSSCAPNLGWGQPRP